jgi:uncharacterized protein (TIGR02391 family)
MDRPNASTIFQRAAAAQATVEGLGLVRRQPAPTDDIEAVFDRVVTDPSLLATTRSLFVDGYYALAVEEAFKCVNNTVKRKAGLADDGASLMRTAFSANKPILRLNAFRTLSEKNQQQGYMDIFAGCMVGIRNPRAHEHGHLDEPHVAIEMLAWANHLIRMVNQSKRARNRAKKVVGS